MSKSGIAGTLEDAEKMSEVLQPDLILLHPYKDNRPGEPEHPKGIDPLTLKKIIAVFSRPHPEGLSAEEVRQQIGTSRTTARRYLEYLTASGHLQAELIYGAVGRPERKYFTS